MSANKSKFDELLNADEEDIVRILYRFRDEKPDENVNRITHIAGKLGLRTTQLVCALGFNPFTKNLPDMLSILGYDDHEQMAQERNDFFLNDIYKKLSLDNLLAIYTRVKDEDEILQIMPYLLKSRLETIESRIEATVNSIVIDKYKAEMRAIYFDRIVGIDFVEERLNLKDSGFRALLNEVAIITESKIIPAGDIFFRETILIEEKRKLLNRGLIPDDLVESRLADDSASHEEKHMLHEYLKLKRK